MKLDDGNFIHEFYLENNNESTFGNQQQQHIVIIHGYMAAMGYFIKNVEDVIKIPGVRLHLIDLPGFGNSSRPKFLKNSYWNLIHYQPKLIKFYKLKIGLLIKLKIGELKEILINLN